MTSPLPANVGSSAPLGRRRTTAPVAVAPADATLPPITMLPDGSTTRLVAWLASPGPNATVTVPLCPNVGSRASPAVPGAAAPATATCINTTVATIAPIRSR
jgi:hypothetical protein